MGYQVLARKYRPRIFQDVVGQGHTIKVLTNALIRIGYITPICSLGLEELERQLLHEFLQRD